MFKKEVVEQVVKVLRIPEDKQDEFITNALSEEKDLTWDGIPEKLHTPDELNQFGQNRFNEGKTAFSEITVKDLKVKYPDVQYQGKKLDEFLNKYSEWKISEAKLPVEEQVNTLKGEKETLQKQLNDKSLEFQNKIDNLNHSIFNQKMNNQVFTLLPQKATVIPKSDILTIFNSEHSFKKDEDGKLQIIKAGKILKDELQNDILLDKYLPGWIDEKKFIKINGMDGEDRTVTFSGKFTKNSEFVKYCEENNINPLSSEAEKLRLKMKTEDFDYDN